MDASIVAAVTARASSQHGLITLDQLRELEISPHGLRSLVGSGWLRPMAPRVYGINGINGVPTTVDRRLTLGLLCLGPDAIVSHEAAARLHGFDRSLPDAVEFTVDRRRRHASALFRVHSTATMPAIDRVTVGGYRCTSATRTIIDLARARIPTVRLEAAIDSAVRSGATAPVVLAQRLASLRGPGRWGACTLDRLLPDSGGHTLLERRFLELMRAAGLPRPNPQVVHRAGDRTVARVDFEFPAYGIVVEVSGRKGHASDAGRGTLNAAMSCRTPGVESTSTPTCRWSPSRRRSCDRCESGWRLAVGRHLPHRMGGLVHERGDHGEPGHPSEGLVTEELLERHRLVTGCRHDHPSHRRKRSG